MDGTRRRLTRSATATVEDCEKLWVRLWAEGGDASSDFSRPSGRPAPAKAAGAGRDRGGTRAEPWRDLHDGGRCEKPKGDLIRPGGSLGLVLRLIVIRDFLALGAGELFQDAAQRSSRKSSGKLSGNENKALQLGSKRAAGSGASLYLDGIWKLVNEKRAEAPHDFNPLPSEDVLFRSQFAGPGAITEYRQMLSRTYAGPQPLIAPRKFLLDDDASRRRQADNISAIVRATETGAAGQPMLVNIHSQMHWSGLSAFAGWLPDIVRREDNRQVLIVPLRRLPSPPGKRPDGYPEPTRAPILNFSEIVGILRAFVQKGTHAVTDAPALRDQEGLFDVIQDIRIRLARQPAILIFDGYDEAGVELRDLERRVADDLLDGLLRRLLEPPLSGIDEPIDLDRFRRNLIVVTSNNRLRLVDQAPHVPGIARPYAEELSGPASDSFKAVLKLQAFKHADMTARLMRRALWDGLPVDFGYLIDGYVGLLEAANPGGATETEIAERLGRRHLGTQPLIAVHHLVGALLDDLKNLRPVWHDIVCLVASAPDGLRKETIWRLALHARTVDADRRPVPDLADVRDWATFDREVAELLAAAGSILGLNHNDSFEGVDDLPHPLEFGTIGFAEPALAVTRSSRSIDILIPEFKHAVRSNWVESLHGNRLRYHAACRLLAEDALQQQTISLRHVDGSSLQSPRPWRRMLSALLHGLQSLPIEIDAANRVTGIANADFGMRDLSLARQAPDFWRFLYAFCYRRMIERPPAWNLSRLYGLDDLKLELLDCFDRPWQLWPDGLVPKPAADSTGLFALSARTAGGAMLFEDFRLSRAQALIAAGQLHRVEAALGLGRGSPEQRKPTARELKRLIDVDLLHGRRVLRPGLFEHLRERLGDAYPAIEHHVDVATDVFLDLLANGAEQDEDLGTRLSPALDILVACGTAAGWGARDFADICDLYFRIAEHHAMVADLADAEERSGGADADVRPVGRAPGDIDYRFCRSLAVYRFAEQLRLRNFELKPLGGQFFASGHVARVSIRVALKLELRARKLARADGRADSRLSIFARYARRMADTLTRHLFRYPRERASQVILEASMLRLLTPSGSDHELENLMLARTYLGRAETLVLGLGRKARVRMRLSFERAKVNRRLAIVAQGSDEDLRARYLAHASYDVNAIRTLADELGLELWRHLADIQIERIQIEAQRR